MEWENLFLTSSNPKTDEVYMCIHNTQVYPHMFFAFHLIIVDYVASVLLRNIHLTVNASSCDDESHQLKNNSELLQFW